MFGALDLIRMLESESQVDSAVPAIHGIGRILYAAFWANSDIHCLVSFLALIKRQAAQCGAR